MAIVMVRSGFGMIVVGFNPDDVDSAETHATLSYHPAREGADRCRWSA